MKPVQTYSAEAIDRLKHWIEEMNNSGHEKYFEIFVDGMRIVHKTNVVEEFDYYKTWIDQETAQIKVLTYNTAGSHRSKPFEFRTDKYVPEFNYQDQVTALKSTNVELLKRIADAEEYISELEAQLEQQSVESGFDLEKLISTFGTVAKQHPDLVSKFEGLSDIFKTPEKEKSENGGFTFKKKTFEPQPEKEEPVPKTDPTQNENENGDVFAFSTEGKLREQHTKKIHEVMQFFTDNPAYIDVVHELISHN